MNEIIKLDHVTKRFPVRRGSRDLRGKGGLGDWIKGRKEGRFTALHDISLAVAQGESLGIIGKNGSGKSTLLSIIAGVTVPSEGMVQVYGRVASLLELGAGFNPVLTGRENIYLNAGLLGMRQAQVDAVYDEIVRFSGISEFMEQPVETYSSGMYVRIGFSVAAFVNPDIFIADEVLAVGDAEFQRKCRAKIGELREQGKTIVFVSHDLGIVNTLCERIILLDKGCMVQRDTAQKTITYYLRQVGREKGIHTFAAGRTEAVFCDGRISLFHDQEEVSAPTGFQIEFISLGQIQSSTDAEWDIEEGDSSGCKAVGRMLRMPVLLRWDMRIDKDTLSWRVAIEAEREMAIEEITIRFFMPMAYNQWMYDGQSGEFPEIIPSDTAWRVVVSGSADISETACLPEPGSGLPPAMFHVESEYERFRLYWMSSDYLSSSRVLCAQARYPEKDCIFQKGNHELVETCVALNILEDQVAEHMAAKKMIRDGDLSLSLDRGKVIINWKGVCITWLHHLYTSVLIGGLWNDSMNLHWGKFIRNADGILQKGESRRFPFSQEWEVGIENGVLLLRIWMQSETEMDLQEMQTSIILPASYTRWKTDHEQGSYGEYTAGMNDWIHCNRIYEPGKVIYAGGSDMPAVEMRVSDDCPEVRMTAINTGYQEQGRVLQALRTSEKGCFHLPAGRHLYFSGTIRLLPGFEL